MRQAWELLWHEHANRHLGTFHCITPDYVPRGSQEAGKKAGIKGVRVREAMSERKKERNEGERDTAVSKARPRPYLDIPPPRIEQQVGVPHHHLGSGPSLIVVTLSVSCRVYMGVQ